MSEDVPLRSQLRGLASDWVGAQRRRLQAQPISDVDKAAGPNRAVFGGQEITEADMQEIKDIRESGGIVSQLMHAKALLNFGGGYEFQLDEQDEEVLDTFDGRVLTLKEWLDENFLDFDLLFLDIGEDAMWYPYGALELLENNAGEFADLIPIEPWTLYPETDEKGNITAWEQVTHNQEGGKTSRYLDPAKVKHFTLNQSSARDQVGISEVLRSLDEIHNFRMNQDAIAQAIELHGFPQRHVKVGREDGAPIRDTELRRVRTIFDPNTTDANTAYFTGRDVEIDTLEAHNFDYEAIQEMSMRNLTASLGMPLEAANIGSDGLGSGMPAEIRMSILKLQITANQRKFARQIVDEVIKPVMSQTTNFDPDTNINLVFSDPMESQEDMAQLISQVGDWMTGNEVRERLDLAPRDDLEDEYGRPQPEQPGAGMGGMGGGGAPF